MANLSVKFLGVKFENPTVLASGVLGVTASSLKNVVRNGAGGVTTKSIWLEPHIGHKNPTMFGNEHYFLNAVGLSDAGIAKARETFSEYGKDKSAPIIASIVAMSKKDFAKLAEEITKLKPDIVEVNISCPNVEDEFGRPFATVPSLAADITKTVKKHTKIPVIVKLSPNVPNISEIAKACADSGADGFCAINTVGPGMQIDLNLRRPILTNKVGGVSGPAIKPVAIRCVYDIYKATKLPIIGTGGIIHGEDALEIMMAGATLVGIGTAVYYRDVSVFGKIRDEMNEWCDKHGVKDIRELTGSAHK